MSVHVTNLSKYERNLSIPPLEVAKRMAEVLKISLDRLVIGKMKYSRCHFKIRTCLPCSTRLKNSLKNKRKPLRISFLPLSSKLTLRKNWRNKKAYQPFPFLFSFPIVELFLYILNYNYSRQILPFLKSVPSLFRF
ncbi:helix-turn-helix domain-containing protein [Aequorivita xiaoshiensis]|uniref:Helix-turn-helix domain-containing protein n=1 Tax=Aequorivita xiaoshiensis TaxID=2874476 RepID=A0A9X1QZI5_9FLAO|nr:helix-turn-helix domain-containing protein [Aequorivita xiaoshiensis]